MFFNVIDPPPTFTLDLTGLDVSAVASAATHPGIPAFFLCVQCDKSLLFPSGIMYTMTTDASGVTKTMGGYVNPSGVSLPHLRSCASSAAGWWNSRSAGSVFDLGFQMGTMPSGTLKYNVDSALAALGESRHLGRHILFMITRALRLVDGQNETEVFDTAALATAADSLVGAIAEAVSSALGTQGGQSALIDYVRFQQGHRLTVTDVPNAQVLTRFSDTASLDDFLIYTRIERVAFEVGLDGGAVRRTLTLFNIPISLAVAQPPVQSTAQVQWNYGGSGAYSIWTSSPMDNAAGAFSASGFGRTLASPPATASFTTIRGGPTYTGFAVTIRLPGLGSTFRRLALDRSSPDAPATWAVLATNNNNNGPWVPLGVNTLVLDNTVPYQVYALVVTGTNRDPASSSGPVQLADVVFSYA
jgi:hypothetical protein